MIQFIRFLIILMALTAINGCSIPLARSSHVDKATKLIHENSRNLLEIGVNLNKNKPTNHLVPIPSLVKLAAAEKGSRELSKQSSGIELPTQSIIGSFSGLAGLLGIPIPPGILEAIMSLLTGGGLMKYMSARRERKVIKEAAKVRDADPSAAKTIWDSSDYLNGD